MIACWSRKPSPADIASFDGLHCASLYRWALRTDWRCPCCRRSAIELIRWSEIRGPYFRAHYADEHGMGFTISLTRHHCHGNGRFPETLICGDCNNADGEAKRKLGLPKTWSFAPHEIARFISGARPHSGQLIIDYNLAREIFSDR